MCLCGAAAASAAEKKPAQVKEKTVTLSIKDGDVLDVLQTLKTQCGVKNLVVDPGIGGKTGSIFVKDIPCSAAFRLVLNMSGLEAKIYENSVVHVRAARR